MFLLLSQKDNFVILHSSSSIPACVFVKCLRNETWYIGGEKFHIFYVDQLVLQPHITIIIFVSIITDVLLCNDQLNLVSLHVFCLCVSDLIHCTNEMNVNIPQLADSLFERTTNTSWVVVFKSLITTHHLMVYGNEVRRQKKIYNLTTNYLSINVLIIDSVVMLSLTVFLLLQRFVQYLASRNTLFNLSNFLDKSGLQGSELIIIIQVNFLSLNLWTIQIRSYCFF